MVSLQEAREAAKTLQDLQSKAALLPELEKQQGAIEAKQQIEALKQKTLADNQALYEQFQQLYAQYKQMFLDLLEAVRQCHRVLFDLYQIRKMILDNRSKFAGKLLDYSITFEGLDIYKDSDLIESQADVVAPKLPRVISVPLPGNPLAGALEEILNRL